MRRAFLLLLIPFLLAPVCCRGLPVSNTDASRFSSDRLARMHDAIQGYVDRGEVAGVVVLVAQNGRTVDLTAIGMQNLERGERMRTNSIFRIASMSKPVTSVAVMMLFEEGRFLLTDPISKFIPGFKQGKVVARSPGTDGGTVLVPTEREITIRDLLTHRSGISYGLFDSGVVGAAYRDAGISDGLAPAAGNLSDAVDKLSTMPLVSQPGKEWHYSLSVDVLGRLVEIVSGMPLDVFLRERIFKPLQMKDTGFIVPEAKWQRFATAYTPRESGGIRPMKDPESFGNAVFTPLKAYRDSNLYFSGGAGLVSTAEDYARFLQMLLNGGELDGVRLLSPKTVQLMTVSHTRDLPAQSVSGGRAEFGLGFAITADLGAGQLPASVGIYWWRGIYGTAFWVDPENRLIAVLLAQRYPNTKPPLSDVFQTLVYQALVR